MANKRAFITGGSALLGNSIIEGLLKNGYQVSALIRQQSNNLEAFKAKFPTISLIYGSLENLGELDLPSADIFFHLAWDHTTPQGRNDEEGQRNNYLHSQKALEQAERMGVSMFVFAGSQAEYGSLGSFKKEKEEDEIKPYSQYGIFKAKFGDDASRFCRQKHIDFLHLRIFSVYGNGYPKSGLLHGLLSSFKANASFKMGPCTHLWNYLHIDDFQDIVMRLCQLKDINQTVNIASPETKPLKDFVKEAKEACFADNALIFDQENPNPEGLVALNPDLERMLALSKKESFIPFREGIKDSYSKY